MTLEQMAERLEQVEQRLALLEGKKKPVKRKKSSQPPVEGFLDPTPVMQVRDVFLASWKAKFGRDYPAWGARENAQLSTWLKSAPLASALVWAQMYPRWTDPYVVKSGHTLWHLISNCVKLDAQLRNFPQYMKLLAEAQAADNVIQGKFRDEAEVKVHEHINQKGHNSELGFAGQDQIQTRAEQQLHGTRG